MHIHLDENAARYAACESPKTVPYVSLETIAKFSNMTMTQDWVRINNVPVHECSAGKYVAAHSTVVKKVDFSYMPIGQPSLKTRSPPRRRPNSARRLRPGFAPGNTELVPAQATPRVSPRTTARTGLGRRLRFPSRCCAASAGLSCPEIAPQYVHTCFTRFLTGTVKAT